MDTNKTIIAFVGRAGSGKDYQSSLLVEQGYHKMAFADALRDIAFNALDIKNRTPEHYEELKKRNCIMIQDSWNDSKCLQIEDATTGHYLTFRKFLELLGTQGIRKYDDNFWANCLVKSLKDNGYKKVCISDLRFPNEFIAVYNFALENDYDFKCVFCDYRSERYQENNNHDSAAMSNYFAKKGFKDLQEIEYKDVKEYLESIITSLV